MALKLKNTNPLPEAEAKAFTALKAEKHRIEERLEDLQMVLEPFLKAQPDRRAMLCGFEFKWVESPRENFSLSKAREKIKKAIWARIWKHISPYVSKSTSGYIRFDWKGGDSAPT